MEEVDETKQTHNDRSLCRGTRLKSTWNDVCKPFCFHNASIQEDKQKMHARFDWALKNKSCLRSFQELFLYFDYKNKLFFFRITCAGRLHFTLTLNFTFHSSHYSINSLLIHIWPICRPKGSSSNHENLFPRLSVFTRAEVFHSISGVVLNSDSLTLHNLFWILFLKTNKSNQTQPTRFSWLGESGDWQMM